MRPCPTGNLWYNRWPFRNPGGINHGGIQMANNDDDLKPGDVVTLRSGSHDMTVIDIGKFTGVVLCNSRPWNGGGGLEEFPRACLFKQSAANYQSSDYQRP